MATLITGRSRHSPVRDRFGRRAQGKNRSVCQRAQRLGFLLSEPSSKSAAPSGDIQLPDLRQPTADFHS